MPRYGAPPDNPAIRAIAEDVAGATAYSLLAVAAHPEAALAQNTVEELFRDELLDAAPVTRKREMAQSAKALLGPGPDGRRLMFGRAGSRSPEEHLQHGGLDNFEDGLEPLDLDRRALGHGDTLNLRVAPSDIEVANNRLTMPAPRGATQDTLNELATRGADATGRQQGMLNLDALMARFDPAAGGTSPHSTDTLTADLGPLRHNAVRFKLVKIHCLDQTNGWLGGETLADKISWSSLCLGTKGEKVTSGIHDAGKFRDGDALTLTPARELAKFRADVGVFPWHGQIVFTIAERDAGGFATFMQKLYENIQEMVSKAVAKAVAEGLKKLLGQKLASIIGDIVAWALIKVLDYLVMVIKDDIFKPCLTGFWIESEQALRHASDVLDGFTSPVRFCDYRQFKGHYRVSLQAQLRGRID